MKSEDIKKPLVSIIIPTYGRPDMLKRAIDSVLNQTYPNIELLVVDDNGVEGRFREETEAIINRYNNCQNLRYIKYENNVNASFARNQGIKQSKGMYIAFLDNDDEMLNRKIELQVNKMESLGDEWGGCYTGYYVQKKNRRETSNETREGQPYLDALARNYYICGGSNLLIRKRVVDDIGLFDETFKRNQDIEYLVRIIKKYKIACVNSHQLVVYQEDVEERKQKYYNYRRALEIDNYYFDKFSTNIDLLDTKDKDKLYELFSLDRFKVCLGTHEIKNGIMDLHKNHVRIITCLRYIVYLFRRMKERKIYGFPL